MKISFVMANYNRRQLLINTLKTIEYYNLKRDIEVIIVDDNSCKAECIDDIPELFKIPIIIVPITKDEKYWTWDGIVFNIGFTMIRGDIVIIQNPENLHVGDIVGYALKNLKEGVFLSFALYSMNQADSNNLIKKTISQNIFSGEKIKKTIGKFVGKKEEWTDGDTCWYNHSKYQVSGCHLISAIMRKDLEDLHGFDERYFDSFAYSDMELRERIKRKGMVIKIIDDPLAIHQRHELSAYKKNEDRFKQAQYIFTNVTQREKIFRAPQNFFYRPTIKKPKKEYTETIDVCPITGDGESREVLNLGNIPLVNKLCVTKEQSLAVKTLPLVLQMFNKSRLTCLTYVVDKTELFKDYVYHSGISKPYIDHCGDMYRYLDSFIGFKKGSHVFDIGGNDGSLLKEFKKINPGLDYINIDASANFAECNRQAGITFINKFFDEKFYSLKRIKADYIISTNVFQHTSPVRSFVKGIFNNLACNGVWCLEFPYLFSTVFSDNYDQVYHEHVYYFLLTNIVDLLKQEEMRVIHVSYHNIHTGTMRVLSVKATSPIPTDRTVQSFLNLESSVTPEYLTAWGNRIKVKIESFKNFIAKMKEQNKTIIGFGAAAKGCVFLNSAGIDYHNMPVIIDDTPDKQGKYMPGTGIFITDRSVLRKMKVDYILILAHNFSDYIIDSLKEEYNGRFIIMFPDIKII
jgi:GT2 family glycosyltransferase